MPVRFRVSLFPQEPLKVSELFLDRLHGVFFSLMEEPLARELHEGSSLKPFSLSFFCDIDGTVKPLPAEEEATTRRVIIEISFLKEDLFSRFLASYMLKKHRVSLGGVPLKVSKKPLIREKDLVGYERLLRKAHGSDRFTLKFITPTTFRRGRTDYPLPDPKLIFKGLIRKWQAFSDHRIDIDLREVIEKGVKVSGAWIGTRRVDFSDMGFATGFRGRVLLSLDGLDDKVKGWLATLLHFGEFAGVGRKTTMGFGKVRLVPEE